MDDITLETPTKTAFEMFDLTQRTFDLVEKIYGTYEALNENYRISLDQLDKNTQRLKVSTQEMQNLLEDTRIDSERYEQSFVEKEEKIATILEAVNKAQTSITETIAEVLRISQQIQDFKTELETSKTDFDSTKELVLQVQGQITDFLAKNAEILEKLNLIQSSPSTFTGLKTFSDGIIVDSIQSNNNLEINTTNANGTLVVNNQEVAYKKDITQVTTDIKSSVVERVETQRLLAPIEENGTRGMLAIRANLVNIAGDIILNGKKHDFNIVKKIRLLKNAHPYGAIMYQEVFYDLGGDIVKYGDIFCNGAVVTGWDKVYTGTLASPISNANFYRVALPRGVEIKDVVGGFGTFFAIENDSDSFWGWGKNAQGALGLGHNNIQFIPTRITIKRGVNIKKMVSRSYGLDYQFCLALLSDGEVYAAGYNIEGELGIGNLTNSNLWARVQLFRRAINIWAGNNYVSSCFALVVNPSTNNLELYSWGWNNDSNGCLGLGITSNCTPTPAKVPFDDVRLEPDMEVYNYCHNDGFWKGNSFIHLKQQGILLGCGYGGQYALNNSGVSTTKFSELIYSPDVDFIYRPKVFDNAYKFNQVLTGGSASIIGYVTSDHQMKVWGYGNWGWGTTTPKPINQNAFKFKPDDDYVIGCFKDDYYYDRIWIITTKNLQTHYPFKLYAFGYNELGQLGVGDALNKAIATKVILPPNVYDFIFQAEYLTEGVFLATDGYTLYGSGTSLYWYLGHSSYTLQPISRINQFNTGDTHEYL